MNRARYVYKRAWKIPLDRNLFAYYTCFAKANMGLGSAFLNDRTVLAVIYIDRRVFRDVNGEETKGDELENN